jgi:hypothetical protein
MKEVTEIREFFAYFIFLLSLLVVLETETNNESFAAKYNLSYYDGIRTAS